MSEGDREHKSRLWDARFVSICLINFALFMSFFFLLPTLPVYLVEELQAREDQVGLMIGMFTIAAVLARPFTGYLMDRSDQKKIYLLSVVIFVLATAGYFIVTTVLLLLLIRFMHGFGFGMASTAGGALAAEWIPADRRGEGIGYYGMFVMVAMAVGPVLGVFIVDQYSYEIMFGVCVAISLLGIVLTLGMRPPKRQAHMQGAMNAEVHQREQHGETLLFRLRRLFFTLFERRAVPVALSMMMIAVVFGGCVTFISLYALELGDQKLAGMYFSLYALALIVTRPFAGKWYDSKGPYQIILFGTSLYFCGMLVLGFSNGASMLYLAAIINGIGYGSLQPSYQALVIRVSPENRRGAATATFLTSFDIGIGIGAFFLGFVAQKIGYSNMFLASSVFLILSFILFVRFWKRKEVRQDVSETEGMTA